MTVCRPEDRTSNIQILPLSETCNTGSSIADRIPVELLEQIFTLACTDGGFTGCSLSCVSWYIRESSRIGRFNTVSLRSDKPAEQIVRLMSCFTAERTRAERAGSPLPKVRHLFLSAAKRTVMLDSYKHPEPDPEQTDFHRNVAMLIKLVAPDLRTLFVVHGYSQWIEGLSLPDIGLVSFPLLEELQLFGCGLMFAPPEPCLPSSFTTIFSQSEDPLNLPQLPRLTHLHLMCSAYGDNYNGMSLSRWLARAPGITHLRLSNLQYFFEDVAVGEIGRLVGSPSSSVNEENDVSMNPQLLIVQPGPAPSSAGIYGTPTVSYSQFIGRLNALHECTGARWALLPPCTRRPSQEEFVQAAGQGWLDWRRGHPGCWSVDEIYFSAGDETGEA